MEIKLFGMICGWFVADMGMFKTGASGIIRHPVPAFLIDHPQGLVLFDSGYRPGLTHSDDPQRALFSKYNIEIEYEPGQDLAGRMATLGYDLAKVRYLITSHLHGDHVGGNSLVPNADWVIQRREWETGFSGQQAELGLEPALYDLGHRVKLLDGEHDLFGDGSIVCIPSYGHTPGHQSLRIRRSSGEIVLTADACFFHQVMQDLCLPPAALNREELLRSIEQLRVLRQNGARLIFGHDPADWIHAPAGWMVVE